MDLTEAEEIKKRWQEYTEEFYKKILMTRITMMVSEWKCKVENDVLPRQKDLQNTQEYRVRSGG